MKVKNQIVNYLIAIVSLFLISCEDRVEPSLYDLQVYAETLGKDDNGFYTFDLITEGISYAQVSRTRIVANTNNPNIQKVSFLSGSWEYRFAGSNHDVPLVNGASYTNDESLAYTWISIPKSMVGDTVYVMVKYFDEYEWVNYDKTIGVIVE